GKVTFSTPKTSKSRRNIPLDPATMDALRHHRDAQDKERVTWAEIYTDVDLVFCREDGSVLRRAAWARHRWDHPRHLQPRGTGVGPPGGMIWPR
ncbi:MAG: hypothetical protein J2P57_16355, partial [Acidimicrobiaceae bacterium]|nr:hypothetical protein [Acidimicrobiaceae bacterium]